MQPPAPRWVILLAILALALAGCGSGGDGPGGTTAGREKPAQDRLPPDFFGVVSDEVFAAQTDERRRILARQKKAGIGLLRQTFDWTVIEPAPGRYDFAAYDTYVTEVARAEMELLPILFNPPDFHSSRPESGAKRGTYPPADPAAMGRFAAAVVARYGPDGSFWDEHPELPRRPIRSWQVWNEPSFPTYWPGGADGREYARLLEVTAKAIREEDPKAEIVAAGLSTGKTAVPVRDFVTAMHAAGAADAYDVLAIHPYAADPEAALAQVQAARVLLEDLGKSAPIWITEIGWATQGPDSPFTVGRAAQADFIERLIEAAAQQRTELGLRGLVYYRWSDAVIYPGGFDFFGLHTGLVELDGDPKPGLRAFAEAVKDARGRSD